MATPNIDDGLAVDVDDERGAELLAVFEVSLEFDAHGIELIGAHAMHSGLGHC